MSNDLNCHYQYVGGKINVKTLHNMIVNGYKKKSHASDNIDGYKLDKSLSGDRAQVYHNSDTNHLVINHRGTSGLHDVMTDVRLMLGDKSNKRFQHGKHVTDEAIKKYDTDNISISGHSLGSAIAKESNNGHNKEIISVNGAVTPLDMFTKQKNNETVVRSQYDPISVLHTLNPYSRTQNTINIKSKSFNPLSEHSSSVLNRLGDRDIGV